MVVGVMRDSIALVIRDGCWGYEDNIAAVIRGGWWRCCFLRFQYAAINAILVFML